ncbi:Trihelix transcription factor PTL, partial [Cucurbita argyrosperma subsp. sororia]
MDDQYSLSDLRHLITAPLRSHFPSSSIPHRDLASTAFRHHHTPYDLIRSQPTAVLGSASPTSFDAQTTTARWPRQETLTLLDVRSRLDSKFKEANQKGPLWDEVSRIMAEEHNYQRSGKKCREKFENLYKYYKKTKDGKAGRQDGKNYRFFRQLEALYGETSNATSLPDSHFVGDGNLIFQQDRTSNPTSGHMSYDAQLKHYCDSLSLSNTSEFETSASSDGNDEFGSVNDSVEKRKRQAGKCWKVKIKQFIDLQMRKLIDKQEAGLEKLMKTLEQKEKERMVWEEEWRKQEVSRIERERSFWAKERAWIEARDAALMEALQKLTGKELITAEPHQNEDGSEILNNYQTKTMDQTIKKRKDNSRSPTTTYNLYFQTDSSVYGGSGGGRGAEMKEQSPNSSNAGGSGGGSQVVQDSCFFLMGEGDQSQSGLWENFGLKLNNGSHRT